MSKQQKIDKAMYELGFHSCRERLLRSVRTKFISDKYPSDLKVELVQTINKLEP